MKNGFRKLLILLLVTCLVSVSACSSVSNLVDSVTGGGSKGETVTMENGATVFRPGDEDIAEDAETGIPYLKGIILAYTLKSPDETLQKKLEKEADGKIVGVQSGIVPMVEIKTKAEGYSDLQALAEKIEAMPDVLIAAPEIVFEFQMEAVNTITQDQTPWAKTGEDPIADEDKGNENQPGGNDRWAEEIRAYSAWDALPELANPLPVGVMDSGIDTEHPEFENRIFLASKNDINNHDDHSTFVSGIIGASGDNNRFVRGIADRSSIYFADTNNGIVGAFYNDSPTPIINSYLTYRETPASVCSYYSYMRSKGVRVINHSFGNNYILTPYEFNNIDKFINDPAYSKLKEAGEELKQKVAKYSDYTDYFQHTLYYAEQSANYLLLYMLVEIANGNDDFLYVQSAGNGSFFQDTPVSSDLNLYFCSIREEKFNEVLLNLREAYEDPEIKERLNHLTWEEFRSHIIIVGGTDEKTAPTADYSLYSSSNYGDGVDLCAPAVNIYGINLSGVANHESCSEETGTSCAAPMVTGSATLLWSAFPDFPASEIKKILTECTDNKVPDEKMTTELFKEHPVLNIGQAVEYSLYYTFVRDQMIPKYGLQKGAQDGEKSSDTDSWLSPEGIVTAWVGNLDGERGDELAVFRFEADMSANYYERPYYLMIDLFTIYNGVVQIRDTLNTGFALRRDYSFVLDMAVSAGTRDDNRVNDILIDFMREEEDLYGSRENISWTVTCGKDGKLSRQDGRTSAYQHEKQIFNMTNKSNHEERGVDKYEFRVTDSCRLTWYLDSVFTDRSYTPEGYVRDYGTAKIGVTDGLWSNPPKIDDSPRLIRTEDYEDGELRSYHQFAYDENGLLIYDGYFHRDGELSSIIKYDYDDAGVMIRESEILSSGKEDNVLCYVNDENGNPIRRDRFPEGGGKVTDWDEYEYDEAGNQTVWRGYRKEKYNFCWYYTYDADGNRLTTERYDEDNYRTLASKNEYDGAGHILYSYGLNNENQYEVEAAYQWSDNFHTRKSPWYYSGSGELAGYDTYTYDDYGNVLSFYTQNVDESYPSRQRLYYYD